MFIAVTNTVRKKGRLLCHVAERTFTSGRMAGGRVAIFAAGHLPARQSMAMYMPKVMQPVVRSDGRWKESYHRSRP